MNLLLLLSALLSALSGLGGNVRAPVSVQAVADAAVTRPAGRIVQRAARVRPVAALPDPSRAAVAPTVSVPSLIAAVPLWASRRRE